EELVCSEPLTYFLKNHITKENFSETTLNIFAELDDYDIVSAIKSWKNHNDFILKNLCNRLLNRNLFKIKVKDKPFSTKQILQIQTRLLERYQLSEDHLHYFVIDGVISNLAYNTKRENISLLTTKGKLVDISKISDQLRSKALTNQVIKYYLCYPKVKD
ncbi:MAG TPA: phosphohydrolase, partial [Flavobacteriaceae bacterium]|nr:phosphohydrolase [Flavobacteriaceae bacterium]